MSQFEKALASISKEKEGMLNTLVEWSNINTGSHNYPGIQKLSDIIKGKIQKIPNTHIEELPIKPHGPNALRAKCRPEAPLKVLLCGHLDTVYAPSHPFQECKILDNNTLRGPGVADMKGGLVVMLTALEAFEQTPWAKNIGWEILIIPDEETGSINSKHLLKESAENNHLGIIFEPSLPEGSLVRTRMGTAHLKIETKGQAAHVGRDFIKGRNALTLISSIALDIDKLNEKFPGCIFNIGKIEGGGPINVVPDFAQCAVGIRYQNKTDQSKIEEKIKRIIEKANAKPGYKACHELNFIRPPKELTPALEYMFMEFQKCSKIMGFNLDWRDTGGASDGNDLANFGLPNIDNLGVRGNNIHSTDEHIIIDSLVERAQLTCFFLMRLGSGQIILPKKLFHNLPSSS